ncbi:MAG: hypothetical protein MUE44_03445 [Oscillatoriaceae cyanobacterium Prado104]|jgi:hypothetical protein|nr:hypothetical protein [Oscillatoriaceae cyanobacterium Prado104]
MRHPFEAMPFGTASIVLVLLVAIAVSIGWQLNQIGKPLTIPQIAPQGIVSLELAFTAEKARRIVEAWSQKENALDRAIELQWIDFLFMLAYSTALSLACIWSTKLLPSFDPRWLGVGIVLAWGQWVAAVFDAIENLCLFPFLYGTAKDGLSLALVAALSAGLKFGLIGLGIIYFLISVMFKVFRYI